MRCTRRMLALLGIDYAVASAGGLGRCDAGAISRQLRRTPYNRAGYLYPIDLVLEGAGSSR